MVNSYSQRHNRVRRDTGHVVRLAWRIVTFGLYADKTMLPFDWGTNGILLSVAAIVALLASVFPARRAVRTPPVKALTEA